MPIGSIVIIVGVLSSTRWVYLTGLVVMVAGYALFMWGRKRPATVADLLFGWYADPRPAPKDVVDRPPGK